MAAGHETTPVRQGRLTIALTVAAVRHLLATSYRVPQQDLAIPINRFPTQPRSGFGETVADCPGLVALTGCQLHHGDEAGCCDGKSESRIGQQQRHGQPRRPAAHAQGAPFGALHQHDTDPSGPRDSWGGRFFTADVMARTYGAATNDPPLAAGRLPGFVEPLWGIDRIETWPHEGSATIYWDSGAPEPPYENVPPREGEDPHSDPRADPDAREQISEFLRPGGVVIDVCAGAPCMAG